MKTYSARSSRNSTVPAQLAPDMAGEATASTHLVTARRPACGAGQLDDLLMATLHTGALIEMDPRRQRRQNLHLDVAAVDHCCSR